MDVATLKAKPAMHHLPDQSLHPDVNQVTSDVIEFLTEPGSDFGTAPDDVESLRTPQTLAGQLRLRLEIPSDTEAPERWQLRERLRGSDLQSVNWLYVQQELSTRLRLTDGFFAQDFPHESSEGDGESSDVKPNEAISRVI